MFGESRAKVEAAFRDAGRSERPIASTLSYFSLDADPEARRSHARRLLLLCCANTRAWSWRGAAKERGRRKGAASGLRAEQGCDELIFFPSSADPGQVDKLAAAVL